MVGETVVTYLLRTNRHLLNLLEDNVQYSETKNERDSLHDLVALLASITLAIKQVGAMVRRMGLPFAESNNPEELNKLANETWITCLLFSRTCCMLVSEDLEEPVAIEDEMQGQYAVVFDALTGLADPPCEDRVSEKSHHQKNTAKKYVTDRNAELTWFSTFPVDNTMQIGCDFWDLQAAYEGAS
mmetsp:Transcript_18038/g.72199  ORF Transcript_18038/g.72199 Transcript_18038/m.72199 type:complete len:185 (-) Transcript_18038:1391-1945(-)